MQLSAARLPSKSFWARGFVTKGEQSAHQGFIPAHSGLPVIREIRSGAWALPLRSLHVNNTDRKFLPQLTATLAVPSCNYVKTILLGWERLDDINSLPVGRYCIFAGPKRAHQGRSE